MDELDREGICLRVSVDVVKSLKLNPKTKHLKTLTPEHTKEWVRGLEEIISDLQESVKITKEKYNV